MKVRAKGKHRGDDEEDVTILEYGGERFLPESLIREWMKETLGFDWFDAMVEYIKRGTDEG